MKYKLYRSSLWLLPLAVSLAHGQAFAQQQRPAQAPTVLTPGIGVPVVTANPGDFNITNTDIGQLMGQQMREYFQRQREDRVFLERTVNELEQAILRLNNEIVTQQLEQASIAQAASLSAAMDVERFIALRTAYLNAKSAVEARIQTLVSMTQGALPSQNTVAVTPSANVTVPGFLVVDLNRIAEYYRTKIAEIDARVQALRFAVKDKSGQDIVRRFQGLNPDMSAWVIITPAERQAMVARIARLETQAQPLIEAQDALTMRLATLSHEFLNTFGASERWRYSQDESFIRRMNSAFEQITEVLWSRDYMRVKYGLPQGVVAITYRKQILNIDLFLRNPREFIDFLAPGARTAALPVRSQEQMVGLLDAYANNVRLAEMRTVSIHDGSASILARANSLVNQIRGYDKLTEAAKILLQALRVDVEHDIELLRGGRDLMVASYRSRYYADDAARARTNRLECLYERDDEDRRELGCTGSPSVTREAGSIRTTFFAVVDQADQQVDNAIMIRDLRLQLAQATQAAQNPERRRNREGLRGLREGGGPAAAPSSPAAPANPR